MVPPALSLGRPLEGARARIVAFPHAGGGASAFGKLRVALAGHGVELCPLQPPGRENRLREPHHATVEALAAEFAAATRTLPPLPTAFLGHSFGGLVAYLAARMLAGQRAAPDHLLVSGSLAPTQRHEPATAPSRARILALGGVPDAILAEPNLFEMFEPGILHDMRIADAYRHEKAEPLACPITVYSGLSDRAAPSGLAPAWQALTRYALRTRRFEGGHFFLYEAPEQMAVALLRDLEWPPQPLTDRILAKVPAGLPDSTS